MTFLGIAETLQGDMTGYIPSNLASMCDGQICLSSAIFAEGFRPAIDIPLSLSILGGRTQPPVIKALSRNLRAEFARYTEVLALSRLQSGLSEEAQAMVKRGEALTAVLQKAQFSPVCLAEQVLLLYALDKGCLEDLDADEKSRFRKRIFAFAREKNRGLMDGIEASVDLTTEMRKGLEAVLDLYFQEQS